MTTSTRRRQGEIRRRNADVLHVLPLGTDYGHAEHRWPLAMALSMPALWPQTGLWRTVRSRALAA
jgi:hypothetical protein